MTTATYDFADVVARSQADPDSIPCTERCRLARRLAEDFLAGDPGEAAQTLVRLLAADPKWEVRGADRGTVGSAAGRRFPGTGPSAG